MSTSVDSLILNIRNQKVILDADLAELYGVKTIHLNQAVKRNKDRFPEDFVFQLSREELQGLKSQIVMSNAEKIEHQYDGALKSQFATAKSRGGRRTLPYAFTEHGALMAANILNSPEAVKMSVFVVRAFIKQREMLTAQSEILKRLAQIDKTLLQHDQALQVIWTELQPLLEPPPPKPKRKLGFQVDGEATPKKARKSPKKGGRVKK